MQHHKTNTLILQQSNEILTTLNFIILFKKTHNTLILQLGNHLNNIMKLWKINLI